ncbi:MFS transporter [Azorhizobium doebereinerae]|uniref:MFS transporter n=1 Tax=Azorhizobium doebereinerae TaxID=281091 RepID=UPI000490FE05|nr:MFS transporter [Azorhizobium doebereinerae]
MSAPVTRPASDPQPARRLAVLRDGNARLLVSGQLASQVCDRMALVGILWFLTATAGEVLVPWYIAAGGLPHLVLTWRSGRVINALGALRVVVWADLLRGVLYLAAAGLVGLLPHGADIAVLFALTLLGNMGAALFNPAMLALPVRLAPTGAYRPNQLTALLNSCVATGNILGPALAALVYKAGGLDAVLAITGAAYLTAGTIERLVRMPPRTAEAAPRPAGQAAAGFALARRYPLVGSMLAVLLAINLCLGPITLFIPLFANTEFTGGIDALAWLQSSMGAGMIAGSLAMASLTLSGSRRVRIAVPVVLTAACYLGFTLAPSLPVACLLLVGLGLAMSAGNVGIIGVFQSEPDEADVPAVMATVNLIGVASLPVSMAAMGALITHVPATSVAIGCAATALAVSFLTPFIPGLNETPEPRAETRSGKTRL